ncbi:MAG: DUF6526 family protein [Thermoanaerobaculia bacterium]|nr:DUF6526 family protein [Thermoanaerobaculia bacterium]
MSTQNYENHGRLVPLFHYGLSVLLLAALVTSGWNFYRSLVHGSGRLAGLTLILLTLAGLLLFWFSRVFALKAQDRAIRAEENLRHFVLTGNLLDHRLHIGQVIGLRFAPDEEFVALSLRAAEEGLSSKDIKQAIKNWRADLHRV